MKNCNFKIKNNNNKNQISRNNYNFKNKFTNNLFSFNKDKEMINDKQNNIFDNDLKSLKSSFYDEDEFVIINYDYT